MLYSGNILKHFKDILKTSLKHFKDILNQPISNKNK